VSHSAEWEGRTAEQWRAILGLPAVHVFEVTDSTNNVALRLAEGGAASLTLVVADHQTCGRGRNGADWLSAPGSSVLCSFVFQTQLTRDHAPGAAPIRIGVAIAEAIEQLLEQPVGLKWPNDIVIRGHGKIAGILCEGAFRQEGKGHIVAGIGVNAFYPGDEYSAISDATEFPPTRAALLQTIARAVVGIAPRITAPLNDDELERARDILLNLQVRTESGIAGRACGIAADGSLQIETTDGVQAVRSATVRLAESGDYPGAAS
jgi:biotin-[acetyl-CoA-carboxylase] ligase BirA-like protein